ncbi:hypothetical protein EV181_007892, partial [Coemansia sp. RSA 532]
SMRATASLSAWPVVVTVLIRRTTMELIMRAMIVPIRRAVAMIGPRVKTSGMMCRRRCFGSLRRWAWTRISTVWLSACLARTHTSMGIACDWC